jgi:hypothetical protein
MHSPDYLNEISELAAEGVHKKTIAAARIILGGLDTQKFWSFDFSAFARRFNTRLCNYLPDPADLQLNLVPGFNALRDIEDFHVDRINDPVRDVTHEFAVSMAKRLTVIGLVGEPGSGRKTLATRLVDGHGFSSMSFDDPLRVATSVLYNLPPHYFTDNSLLNATIPALGMSPARCMEIIGGDVCQGLRRSVWEDRLLLRMAAIGRLDSSGAPKVVVSGLRLHDQAEYIRSIPGGQVAWVSRQAHGQNSLLSRSARPGDLHLTNTGDVKAFLDASIRSLGLVGTSASTAAPAAPASAVVGPAPARAHAPR